jgi:hypothetical protein
VKFVDKFLVRICNTSHPEQLCGKAVRCFGIVTENIQEGRGEELLVSLNVIIMSEKYTH